MVCMHVIACSQGFGLDSSVRLELSAEHFWRDQRVLHRIKVNFNRFRSRCCKLTTESDLLSQLQHALMNLEQWRSTFKEVP